MFGKSIRLLAKLKVEKVMTRKVITVSEDTPIEEAARLMVEKKIGGLPVMQGKKMVGIITVADLFKVFFALFGGMRAGVRVSASISGAKGTFSKITGAISQAGGNIVGLGFEEVSDFPQEDLGDDHEGPGPHRRKKWWKRLSRSCARFWMFVTCNPARANSLSCRSPLKRELQAYLLVNWLIRRNMPPQIDGRHIFLVSFGRIA